MNLWFYTWSWHRREQEDQHIFVGLMQYSMVQNSTKKYIVFLIYKLFLLFNIEHFYYYLYLAQVIMVDLFNLKTPKESF